MFNDGPVTGELARDQGKAPKGTRLEGHLWTTGDRIYGRYRLAHLPNGRTVPICVELIAQGGGWASPRRRAQSPATRWAFKEANGLAVKRWR